MRIEETIAIDAPAEEIWEIVTDPAQYAPVRPHDHPLGARGRQGAAGSARATRCACRSARPRSAASSRSSSGTSAATWRGTASRASTSAAAGGCGGQEDGTTRVSLRLSYQAPGGLLGTVSDRLSVAHRPRQPAPDAREPQGDDRRRGNEFEGGSVQPGRVHRPGGGDRDAWRSTSGLARPSRPDKLVRALTPVRPARPDAGRRLHDERDPAPERDGDRRRARARSRSARCTTRTNALANAWLDAGLGEGDGVAIMCRNHRGFVEATVAASKLGAARALPQHGVRRRRS